MKDGLWIDYFRPEQIAFQGKYEKNIKVGKWEWFWLNRSLMSNVTYDNGTISFEECYNRSDGSCCSDLFRRRVFSCEDNTGIQKRQRSNVEARHCKLYHVIIHIFPKLFRLVRP